MRFKEKILHKIAILKWISFVVRQTLRDGVRRQWRGNRLREAYAQDECPGAAKDHNREVHD